MGTRETSTAGSEFHTGMGDKEWFQVCSPQVQIRTLHCTPVSGSETPTEVYNKPFRLRDLRRSIMKTKPRAPGPDGIHNNLLKHLPENTLKILKEILNKIWTSTDFPHHWRAATVIPIPKPNKDHTDQPGNMVSSEIFTGLASEADCLFLCQNISGTGESESELGQHSLKNSTQRKVFQLAVS